MKEFTDILTALRAVRDDLDVHTTAEVSYRSVAATRAVFHLDEAISLVEDALAVPTLFPWRK